MDRVFEALRPFIRAVVRYAWAVLAVALLCSAFGFYYAQDLRIDTDLANLLPADYPSVQALEKLRATVGGESEVAVAIESGSFEANKAFAEALIPQAMALQGEGRDEPYFTRVNFRKEVTFLENNALYFATDAEFDELETYLEDQIEAAKLEANPFFFDLEDEDDEAPDSSALALEQIYDELIGKEYPISDDSLTMVLQFYPSGSQTNISFLEDLYADLDALVAEVNPTGYAADMEVILAGRLYRQLTEVRAIQNDVLRSFGAGVGAVLLLVLAYFLYKSYQARASGPFAARVLLSEMARLPVLAVLVALPLAMSLTWTFGITYLVYGELNLMTSTLGLVLFGLGIDYGIHFYARYSEERAQGKPMAEAAEVTFVSTGQAITVGALTTALALYVLMVADFKGFSEFGFIAGTGILFALLGMLVVMPALLSVFDQTRLLDLKAAHPQAVRQAAHRSSRIPGARGILIGSAMAVLLALVLTPGLRFEYAFGKLEPVYEDYQARGKVIGKVYQSSKRNPAYIVVDNPAEARAVSAVLQATAAADTTSPTIASVESLEDRFPLREADRTAKLGRIAALRTLLDDPILLAEPSADLDRIRKAAQTTAPIEITQVPADLRERFQSKSGEIGNFVIIYPSVGLSDGRQSMAFARDVGRVETADGQVFYAGSTSLVAASMLELMQAEAPWMILATFLIVVVLMVINFGSVRWAMLALIPLVVGVLWMLLLMEILELKLNFYNLIVLPAVLGIGNDAGVHLVHRYREEGPGSLWHVLRSTGEHVTMGSLTTMVGFSGLMLSFHPGLNTIGQLAVVGIGATLIAALLFLPALLQWLEDRQEDAPSNLGPAEASS